MNSRQHQTAATRALTRVGWEPAPAQAGVPTIVVHRLSISARRFICLAAFVVLTAAPPSLAQTAEPAEDSVEATTPLARKQEMIRDRFKRLEDRMFRLHQKLAETEPDNAQRLQRAVERSGELALLEKLSDITEKLNSPEETATALEAQQQWIEEVDKILAILAQRDSDNDERKREIERLQAYRQKLEDIIERQQQQRDEAAARAMTGRALEQTEQALKRLEALQRRQESLEDEARSLENKSLQEKSGDQKSVARDTTQLAEELEKLAEQLSPEGDPAPQKAEQSDEASKGLDQASDALKSARQSMNEVSRGMEQSQRDQAQEAQQQAREELEEAREQLEKAREILRKQEEKESNAAEEQRKLAQDTSGLGNQMREEKQEDGQSPIPGMPGAQQQESTPGQQQLDQAEREMRDAAERLDENNPEGATEKQDKALEELKSAREQLEEALHQQRKEDRAEALRDLESRFRRMLAEQRIINEATLSLHEVGEENFGRAEELNAADLAQREQSLSADAATALHILDEDGTTVAFPRVMEQLSEDMAIVASRLAEFNVGPVTQTIEDEIVETLEQLLQAVKQMQQQNEQQQQQGQSGQPSDNAPLLPPSAEIKLLRESQLRVNKRTAVIEVARKQGGETGETLQRGLEKVAQRQDSLAQTARELREQQEP